MNLNRGGRRIDWTELDMAEKTKKLLFFISNLGAGGAQRSLMTTTEALHRCYGIEVYVASWPEKGDKFSVPDGVEFIDLGTYSRHSNGKMNYFHAVYTIRQAVRQLRPDWVVATMSDMYMRTFLGCIGLPVHLMVWEHTSMGRKLHLESRIARKCFYRFADLVLVLTNKDLRQVAGKYKHVDVMPNPLSFPVFTGTAQRENIVVAIGRLDVWYVKGFDRLISMWAKVCRLHPSWRLMIVGEGNNENTQHIRKMLEEHHVEDSVVLAGYRTDVQDILRHSKVFVLPSRVEGFPMCLVEAMSQGCACVSFSMQGAVKDIIRDGEDGFIIDDNKEDAFAQVLSDLLSDDVKMNQLAECAINNINRFTPERIAGLWKNLVDSV